MSAARAPNRRRKAGFSAESARKTLGTVFAEVIGKAAKHDPHFDRHNA